MAVRIGSLLIRLAVEHGLLQEGLARSERDVAKTTKAIQRRGQEIADFGQKMSLAVSLPLAALAVSSVQAAKESADALGQVNAALASMGDASGRTAEQLQALAGAQMGNSLIDDDQILREVTANLLTFGRIAGQEFDRAQQAALDLSTRLGTDLTSATVQIGKALNDPVKGVSALAKAGIQFSTDQKAMIASLVETGNVAAAQRIILGELEAQFGGAAQAARDADPGAALAQSFANFQEEIGAKLLPLLPAITAAITGLLDVFSSLPEPVQQGVIVLGAIAAVLGPIAIGLGAVISGAAGLIATIGGFPAVASVVGLAMNTLLLSPLGLIVVAIGAVVAAWYYWDEIKAIVADVGRAVSGWWTDSVLPTLKALDKLLGGVPSWWIGMQVGALKAIAALVVGVKDWLVDKLGAIFDWVGKKIATVGQAFYDLYIAVVGNSYVPDMVEGIRVEMAKLQAFMVDPARKAAASVTAVMKKMAADVAGTGTSGPNLSIEQRDARLAAIGGRPLDEIEELEKAAARYVDGLGKLADDNKVQTVRIAETYKDMVDSILGSLRQLADGIKGGDFFSIIEGLAGIATTLGGAGVFGKGFQARVQGIPGNANGTAYHPGGLMKVGERGPEILQVPRGGRVVPNHELRAAGGGALKIVLEERTDLVAARIDGRIAEAAPGIAGAGADLAMSKIRRTRERALA